MELNQEQIEAILDRWSKITDAHSDRVKFYHDWARNLGIISTTLLGLLVALKSKTIQCSLQRDLFLITIVLLGLMVFLSVLIGYSRVSLQDKIINYHEKLVSMIRDKKEVDAGIYQVDVPIFYKICSTIYFPTFMLSLVSLITYTFLTV